jgi:hypothetical protein
MDRHEANSRFSKFPRTRLKIIHVMEDDVPSFETHYLL